MSDRFEELRRKEVELQEKQLFAQRVTAAASVANAAAAAHQAATLSAMQSDLNEAAEAAAHHQRKMAEHQREIAEHQREMAEEQRVANFRNTVLTALPLLKDEEKTQYLTEQLLPRIKAKGANKAPAFFRSLSLGKVLEDFGLVGFASNYTQATLAVRQFFTRDEFLAEELAKLKAVKAEVEAAKAVCKTKQSAIKTIENEKLKVKGMVFNRVVSFVVAYFVSGLTLGMSAGLVFSLEKMRAHHDDIITFVMLILSFGAAIGAAVFSYRRAMSSFKKTSEAKQVDFQLNKQLRVERLNEELGVLKREIESFAGVEEAFASANAKLKEHKTLWPKIKADFVDDYLASASTVAYLGEQAEHKRLLTIAHPWQEAVAEEQGFLPPSARLPFVEYWLPLLIKEDDYLQTRVNTLQIFQTPFLKGYLLELVEPDYERQLITINSGILSRPLFEALGALAPKVVAALQKST